MSRAAIGTAEQAMLAAEPALGRIGSLVGALSSAFVERDREARLLALALLSSEHVLLLGDPGTGKSALTSAFCGALQGATQYSYLLGRYSVPEELFGPLDLAALKAGHYRRVTTGRLPEAHVAFLDEIFKANSAILNALLTVLNERTFDDDGCRKPVPLELCVGASNEMPEDDAGLEALFDRFLFRRWVSAIKDRDALRGLLASSQAPAVAARIDRADIAAARAAVGACVLGPDALDALLDLRDKLAVEHKITASDRRWRKCAQAIRAAAVLDGRATVQPDDLLVLADVLWRTPDEAPVVAGTVAALVAPDLAEAQRLLDAAIEVVGKADWVKQGADTVAPLASRNQQLKAIAVEVGRLSRSAAVVDVASKITAMQGEFARRFAKRIGAL